jgi:hypothetical protein
MSSVNLLDALLSGDWETQRIVELESASTVATAASDVLCLEGIFKRSVREGRLTADEMAHIKKRHEDLAVLGDSERGHFQKLHEGTIN